MILGLTSTVIHRVKQRLLRNQPGSALQPLATSCTKDYKAHSLYQTSFAESPNSGTQQQIVHQWNKEKIKEIRNQTKTAFQI